MAPSLDELARNMFSLKELEGQSLKIRKGRTFGGQEVKVSFVKADKGRAKLTISKGQQDEGIVLTVKTNYDIFDSGISEAETDQDEKGIGY